MLTDSESPFPATGLLDRKVHPHQKLAQPLQNLLAHGFISRLPPQVAEVFEGDLKLNSNG